MKISVQTLMLFVTCLVFLLSCETVIDMKLPEQPPKLVVNSIFTPDSIIMLHLSKSQFVLKNEQIKPVIDGDVLLFENGSFIGKLIHLNKGFYYLPGLFPKENKQYTINASGEGLKNVEAKDTIPSKPIINQIELSSSYFEGQSYKDFIVYINDNPSVENYYIVSLIGKRYEYIYDTLTYNIIDSIEVSEQIGFVSQDKVFEEQFGGINSVFSDKLFNGKIYPLRISVSQNLFDETTNMGYFEISIILKNISQSYAKYLITYANNSYSDPFSQPVQVFTNVKNGFGIFAGYSSTISSVKIR